MIIIIISIFFVCFSSLAYADDDYYQKYEDWKYTIIHEVRVENTSSSPAYNVKIIVPLMDNVQPAYQEILDEQFNPWPNKFLAGNDGARKAIYIIPYLKPNEVKTLKQYYLVKNYSIKYNLDITNIKNTYSENIDIAYISPAAGIESNNPEIIAYAKQIAGSDINPYILARKAFADINLYLTYTPGENANKGALNALRTGQGVCEDYTDLFIAVMRALGIPARKQTGYLHLPYKYNDEPYFNNDTGMINLNIMMHSWPEFYLPETGWVALDPTFTYEVNINGEMKKFLDWSYFANIPIEREYIFFSEGDATTDNKVQYSYSGGNLKVSFDAKMAIGEKYLPFNDIENHWAQDSIIYLNGQRLLAGIGEGLFGINNTVTRAQAAVLLQRIFNFESGDLNFKDVSSSYWAASEIAAVQKASLMIGLPDGYFKPEQALTRAEIAVILVRAFKLSCAQDEVLFTDLGQTGWAWADQSIITISNLGIATGVGNGLFLPNKTLTRAEFAVLLANVLRYRS